MNSLRRISRGLVLAAVLAVPVACIDQAELVTGTDPADVLDLPLVRHTRTTYVLYEGDSVRVRLEGTKDISGEAEVLVLNAAHDVLWRSPEVAVRDTVALLPVVAVPASFYGDTTLRLSLSFRAGGTRVYASEDTVAVTERARAATKPVRFFPGRVVGVQAGQPQSLVLDAAAGRLFFASRERAEIGVLDLAAGNRLGSIRVPSGPVALAIRDGTLGALIADGTELAVFDTGELGAAERRILLPTLALAIRTMTQPAKDSTPARFDTLNAVVRPFGQGLAWGCSDAQCGRLVAFTSSDVASANDQARSVVRRVTVRGSAVSPLLSLGYTGALPTDTIPSEFALWGTAASGRDSLAEARVSVLRCPTVSLGDGPFDVAWRAGAVLYATVEEDVEPCGVGTRLMRVDDAASSEAGFSFLARRNLVGENRIGRAREIRVSPDGAFVLVRADGGRVHLFDADLRLRATLMVESPTAVAWLQGGSQGSTYFAVASSLGVVLYDTQRRLPVTRFPVGPTRESLLVLWRSAGEIVAAAAPLGRDGLVTARLPFP